ncbi:GNAT family N-acetyltransferase [Phreatobacter sp. AB_2022a]|uniref:GNAT family N-acetyltransferase n=1 Tax=Phreatobacter sp. AB_2022a TaxID=3003134 RepID=UPI0022876F34|nr:GNAT family N-acetyltransferase [Phreatobacter sp. AB_2022a]MCZ0738130.1 GNAT family N-acetyltransferase [Phreatobacter sp. AB_2022a]
MSAARPAVTVTAFDPARLPAMTDLWVATWAATYPAIDFDRRRGWFTDRITAFVEDGVAVPLAFVGSDLAGLVTVDPAGGWIDQMLVGLAFQGGGAGAALMAEARRLSPNGLSLDVNADNGRAIAFYRREGFVRTGGRINGQGAAIDIMTWTPAR